MAIEKENLQGDVENYRFKRPCDLFDFKLRWVSAEQEIAFTVG